MSGSIALGDFQSGDGAATRANRGPSQAATWPTKDIYHQDSVAREDPAVLRGEDTNKSGEFIVTSQKLTTNDGELSILNGEIIHHSYTSRCGIEEGLF